MHKKRAKQSTKISVSSSTVINSLHSLDSASCLLRLRRCVSATEEIQEKVFKMKERSWAALKGLKEYKQNVIKQNALVELLKLIKH